jgi:hypothetical protein
VVRQKQEQRHFLGYSSGHNRPDLDREKDRIHSHGYGPVLSIHNGDDWRMDTGRSSVQKSEIVLIQGIFAENKFFSSKNSKATIRIVAFVAGQG